MEHEKETLKKLAMNDDQMEVSEDKEETDEYGVENMDHKAFRDMNENQKSY